MRIARRDLCDNAESVDTLTHTEVIKNSDPVLANSLEVCAVEQRRHILSIVEHNITAKETIGCRRDKVVYNCRFKIFFVSGPPLKAC